MHFFLAELLSIVVAAIFLVLNTNLLRKEGSSGATVIATWLFRASSTRAQEACVTYNTGSQWCGCGYNRQVLGPCVGGSCPDGYMCICDYCCEGCMDDCYDCAYYSQFCNNTNYCELRQKCQRTCGICNDADDDATG